MYTKQELYQLDHKDLEAEVAKGRKELFKYKFGLETGHLKNNHLIKSYRRYIARMLTIMREIVLNKNSKKLKS